MAKRTQRSPQAAGKRAGPGAAPASGVLADEDDVRLHIVVGKVGDQTIAFRLDDVTEIIRLPKLAFMPLAPRSLLGLANLRGSVLPVASLRRLLGFADAPPGEAARVVVIDRGAPVGFVVDRIVALRAASARRVDEDKAAAGRFDRDLVAGVVRGSEGEGSVTILEPERLLRNQFSRLGIGPGRAAATVTMAAKSSSVAPQPQNQISLVSFYLDSQEYALPLGRVQEIILAPEHVSEVAGAETAVLGVVTLRDRLLPLVSLRALLGLPPQSDPEERGKVVVLSMGKTSVGVVADRTREILRIDPTFMDAAPALLTRGEGDAEIESICRLDDGRRIVAVLSPDRLFRSDLVRRVLSEAGAGGADIDGEKMGNAMADEQFIIFRLGDQQYGVPIAAVDEIARSPDQITRLPKAPSFVDGVMNLRGSVVPIVDLRRRFELGSAEPGAARRILILAVGGGQTGFMVDAVSEVLRVPADAIRQAPELSAEQKRLIGRVANLNAEGRMILLVDPAELLDQIEADMLAKFDRTRSPKELSVS